MSEDLKKIKELADELSVTKQNIQYHYQRLPKELQLKNSNGSNLCLLYTSPSPRDVEESRMPSSA